MKKNFQLLLALPFLCVISSACSAMSPEPTPTMEPTATATPLPTSTATHTPPPSLTPPPLPTHTPTIDVAQALSPEGEPAEEWNGVPIMPEAIAGEASAGGYIFSIDAVFAEIEAFYDREMAALGWERFATGTNPAGQSVMLIFTKGEDMIVFAFIEGTDGLSLVMITGE